jgi:TolB-like protein
MERIVNPLTRRLRQYFFWLFLFLVLPLGTGYADATRIKTIAIMPFETHSQTDITYITSGILTMLHTRLSWKGHVDVVQKSRVEDVMSQLRQPDQTRRVVALGEKTQADYVITGSITEFSGAFSIDTRVYDLTDKSYMTFYGQSKTIDKVIFEVDIFSAKINKKVFDRTTRSYEKFERDHIITQEQLKRINPERMMPMPAMEEETKPWWKVW